MDFMVRTQSPSIALRMEHAEELEAVKYESRYYTFNTRRIECFATSMSFRETTAFRSRNNFSPFFIVPPFRSYGSGTRS